MSKFSNVKQRKDGCFTNEMLIAIIIITLFESQIILVKFDIQWKFLLPSIGDGPLTLYPVFTSSIVEDTSYCKKRKNAV